jgi:hypothetical protein
MTTRGFFNSLLAENSTAGLIAPIVSSWTMSGLDHARQFRGVRGISGIPLIADPESGHAEHSSRNVTFDIRVTAITALAVAAD